MVAARTRATTKTLATDGGNNPNGDALGQWLDGVGARVTLQADLTWGAMQDGYADAGAGDVGSPYALVWWDLEPGAQHCDDCVDMATNSPYDPPGSGGNELNQTPGDGRTECGAACKCDLDYGPPGLGKTISWEDIFPPDMPQMQQVAPTAGAPGNGVSGRQESRQESQQEPQQEPQYSREVLQPQPLPDKDAALTTDQKAALDAFRSAWAAWDVARGALPSVPPIFGASDDYAEGELDAFTQQSWDDLTPPQQRAYVALFEALVSWDAATKAAAAAAHDARDGQQMVEPP